jgi:hypothetical protein
LTASGPDTFVVGPFTKSLLMVSAGRTLRHARRAAPRSCVQLVASAKALDVLKGRRALDTQFPECMTPTRKGALTGVWRVIAPATDCAPANWPCESIRQRSERDERCLLYSDSGVGLVAANGCAAVLQSLENELLVRVPELVAGNIRVRRSWETKDTGAVVEGDNDHVRGDVDDQE